MQQDIIFIKGLAVNAVIGVFDWEKEIKQPLVFDIDLYTDLKQASESDNLQDTVCYKTVSDDVIALTEASRFDLIESLAEQVCEHVLSTQPGVKALKLTLNKPDAVPAAQSVGLNIYRQR
ncbi:dihydroneopterin aldolase [Hydrogenovibrio kuenenii]|uniref:dihydroneopterin aldolase n=1 Tax=Hydrogenovibrio kuenenii TaxID=63658 RepID=UPI000463731B|nr:dihydroneopterin aldolase [Hydrogenovibrio kuenenii]